MTVSGATSTAMTSAKARASKGRIVVEHFCHFTQSCAYNHNLEATNRYRITIRDKAALIASVDGGFPSNRDQMTPSGKGRRVRTTLQNHLGFHFSGRQHFWTAGDGHSAVA
jgi:hypothetical protein